MLACPCRRRESAAIGPSWKMWKTEDAGRNRSGSREAMVTSPAPRRYQGSTRPEEPLKAVVPLLKDYAARSRGTMHRMSSMRAAHECMGRALPTHCGATFLSA